MRLLISGGGTGGHVYPALAVRAQLAALGANGAAEPAPDVLWVGSADGVEAELVRKAGLPFRSIQTGQLRGKSPLAALGNLTRIFAGVGQALQIVNDYRPDVCFVTGGYVCAPVAVACRLRQIPILVYLPDMTPGLAVRALSRLATRVAVSFEEVGTFFGKRAVVTGYPVRPELLAAAADREAARRRIEQRFEFSEERPLLLIFGGSQGSRSINRAVWSALPEILKLTQVLHIIGTRDFPLVAQERPELPPEFEQRYHPVAYLEAEMADALVASDLAVARAGASTLGEFPIARLPSILVPLPIAGGHQWENAKKLVDVGGARILADDDLGDQLAGELTSLLQDEERRLRMSAAVAGLARPGAARHIARELEQLAGRRTRSQWNERYA